MAIIDSLEPRQLFAAGAIDTTFGGGDGTVDVRTNVHDWAATTTDAAVDDQGRTIIAAYYRKHRQVGVTRLTADGAVDPTFGKAGIFAIDSGFNAKGRGTFQIAADHQGRVLVMLKNRLTRLNADGGFDRTFGSRGAVAKLPVFVDVADVTVDADDRPVIVGNAQGKAGTRGAIVRLTAAGALDASFGSGGAYETSSDQRGVAVKVLDDGRIVGVVDYYDTSLMTFRLDAAGAPDATYGVDDAGNGGGGSITLLGFDNHEDAFLTYAFEAFRPDGGMYVEVDDHSDNPYRDNYYFDLIDADGQHVRRAGGFDVFNDDLTVQDDGKVLVAEYPTISRRDADFAPDAGFAPVSTQDVDLLLRVLVHRDRALTFGKVFADGEYRLSVVRVTAIALA